MTLLSCNSISHFECINTICELHFQQNKSLMHSARSEDSFTRFKGRIEIINLDPGEGGGNFQWMETRYTCPLLVSPPPPPPPVTGKNQEQFALVKGKKKKNSTILHLKRVKFEIFARVIGKSKKISKLVSFL